MYISVGFLCELNGYMAVCRRPAELPGLNTYAHIHMEAHGCPGNRVSICMVSVQSRNWSTMEKYNDVPVCVCVCVNVFVILIPKRGEVV